MKSKILLSVLILLAADTNAQSSYPSYYFQNELGLTSPGAMKFGLYGYDNPASLALLHQPDVLFLWSDKTGSWNDMNHWGLFAALPNLGFGMVKQKFPGPQENLSFTDYKISAALGNPSFSAGFSYGWSSGGERIFRRGDLLTLGSLIRPAPFLSLGVAGNIPFSGNSEGVLDLAVRPFGNEKLALFGDYIFKNSRNPGEIKWSAGAAFELIPGLRITGRYFDTKIFNTGIQVSFGRVGLSAQSSFDKDGDHLYNVYGIRLGAYDRTFMEKFSSNDNYLELNLLGKTKYQRFRLFDNSNTLYGLLNQIEAAENDPSVSGIAVNTSGMEINREMLWELRKKLEEFRSSGKKVVVFIDRADIDHYHFASVADKIVMDPQGMIILEGYMLGRNYYKGTLDKLGIGFTEFRYFKYKSAAETYARERMSEADREQNQKLVDDFYQLAKDEICNARNISLTKFDDLVNNQTAFLPADALRENLIDTTGRWDSVEEILKKLEKEDQRLIEPGSLTEFNLPRDNHWGRKPGIAVIYALGVCAMDEGIRARELVKDIETVKNNDNIKAVILRVDSPGGDGLASDIVAEELRKCGEKKPVIVSQGHVAASGGYWLSMYGDSIFAAPNTITGSIGVIGAWVFNKELKEKIGVSTDLVKRGEHADLGFGFTIPILGLQVPDRDLTETEKKKVENIIKTIYKDFISKAASGRDTSAAFIDSVGQGRVWSGNEGIKINLIDRLGGLYDAVESAAQTAGLKRGEYDLVFYPSAPLIDFSFLMPRFVDLGLESDPFINHLKFRLKYNGIPMPILPVENFELIPVQ